MRHKLLIMAAVHQGDIKFIHTKLNNIARQKDIELAHVVYLNNMNYDNIGDIITKHIECIDYSNSHVIFTKNMRLYETWNYAIKQYDSEYIVNANADDLWSEDYISKCIKILDEQPDINIVTSNYYITDVPNQSNRPWKNIIGDIMPQYPDGTLGPSPMFRRSLIDRFGPYRSDLTVAGDAEIWERWRQQHACVYYRIPEHDILYLARGDSLERRRDDKGSLYSDIDSSLINGPPRAKTIRVARGNIKRSY